MRGVLKVQNFDTSFDSRHLHIAEVSNCSDLSEIYCKLCYIDDCPIHFFSKFVAVGLFNSENEWREGRPQVSMQR